MRKYTDVRLLNIVCVLSLVLGVGYFVTWLPSRGVTVLLQTPSVEAEPLKTGAIIVESAPGEVKLPLVEGIHRTEINLRFQQAVSMLHTNRFEYALAALNQVLLLSPNMPEAHVNKGYALLGLKAYDQAVVSFEQAVDLRPGQANAYYGLAVALEASGDVQGARSAMGLFVHLAEAEDPYIRKARAALWEWKNPTEGSGQEESG